MEDSFEILWVAFTSSQRRAPSLRGRWPAEILNLPEEIILSLCAQDKISEPENICKWDLSFK